MPLDPHWNLAAYDVRQQGAAADPGDSHVIRVRLSVANHAPRAAAGAAAAADAAGSLRQARSRRAT